MDAEQQHLRQIDAAQALNPQPADDPLSSDQRDALCVLGYSFIQHRQTDKALTLFEALHALLPDDPHVQKSLSYVYLTAQRYSEALETAERWEQGDNSGDSAPIFLIQSQALWGLDRAEEARQRLQRYVEARGAF